MRLDLVLFVYGCSKLDLSSLTLDFVALGSPPSPRTNFRLGFPPSAYGMSCLGPPSLVLDHVQPESFLLLRGHLHPEPPLLASGMSRSDFSLLISDMVHLEPVLFPKTFI